MDAISESTEASDPAILTGNNQLKALQQQMEQSLLDRGLHLDQLAKEIEVKAKAAAEKVAANAAELMKVRGVLDGPVAPLARFENLAPVHELKNPSEQPVNHNDRNSRPRGRSQDRNPASLRDDHSRDRTRRICHRSRSRNSTRNAETMPGKSRNDRGINRSNEATHQRGRSRDRSPALHIESKVDNHSRVRTRRSRSRERGLSYGRNRGSRVSRRRSRERSPNHDRRRRSRSRERRGRSRSKDRTSSRDHDRPTGGKDRDARAKVGLNTDMKEAHKIRGGKE